jgi:acyl-coenzyme A synthetase/AMP-(fatty) acid ligase
MPAERLPLTARPASDVIFRRGAEAITVAGFLADVAATVALLPARGSVANLCTDRYLALVGFAAALAAGHTTLLSADRSPRRIRELAEGHGATLVLAEAAEPGWALPVLAPRRAAAPGAGPMPAIPADMVAAIAFTSGSTGEPTPHTKPWGSLVGHALTAAERFRLRAGDGPPATLVATVPAQHMYGFETTIMVPLVSAAAGYAGPNFYPSDVAEGLGLVPGRRILVTTPLQLRAQLDAAAMPEIDAVISATAPLGAEIAAAAERAWGTRVLEIYGATEAGSLASRRTLDGDAWSPYPGIRFAIEDECAVVEVPGLPHRVPLADALAPLADGGFRLLGRRNDVVKLAGKRASLAGLNRILTGIEGVRDGVFLPPEDLDRNPAARLSAFVVAPERSAEQIIAALRERIESVFLPRPVVMVPALPRDALGKLSQRALAALRGPAP